MAISRDDSRWVALADALLALSREVDAVNAVVADVSENLWCRAVDVSDTEMTALDDIFALAMSTATGPLQGGGTVRLVRAEEKPFVCAISFAGIYLLLIWFEQSFDASRTLAIVDERLPQIERLTLALPPDDPTRPLVPR